MSDTDSVNEFPPLKKVSSFKGHKNVPKNQEFELRFKPYLKKKFRLLYSLKEGQSLPHTADLEGMPL